MTLLLLIRHGTTDAVGQRLVGRAPGIALNAQGMAEARALAARLERTPLHAVYSSPLERAVATATALAAPHALPVVVRDALTDFDFGDWTGKAILELAPTAEFQRFNARRSGTRPPRGEHGVEVQARMVSELASLAVEHPDSTIAVVSHADPIRSAIGFFLGIPLDLVARLEVSTGSLSQLTIGLDHVTLLSLNERP